MRRLPVDLAAAGYVTTVDVLLPEVDASGSQSLGLLAVGAVAGGSSGVAPLGAGRWGLTHVGAAGAAALGTASAASSGSRVVVESEAGRSAREHRLVGVLEEVVAGGGGRREEVVAGQGQTGVVGRVVGHLGGVDADAHGAADVEPAAGGRSVHVPPAVAGLDAAVRGARHGVEGPGFVGVSAVDGAQGRALHFAENAALVVMWIAGGLGTGRAGEVEIATVLRRGGGAGGDRCSGIATGTPGAACRCRSLRDASRRASGATSARVLR